MGVRGVWPSLEATPPPPILKGDLKMVKYGYKEPYKKLQIIEAAKLPELEELQRGVGGWIETYPIGAGVICVLNEEGKLLGLKPNFDVWNDTIVGNVFFFGHGGEDFKGLDAQQVEKLKAILIW